MSSTEEVSTSAIKSSLGSCIHLTPDESKLHIDLYKFCLEFAFKAITIFFAVVGGVLTLILRPGQEASGLSDPVKRFFLITSFLVSVVMIVGFGVATVLWVCLWQQVKGKLRWRTLVWSCLWGTYNGGQNEINWNESNLVVGLYSPSLTLMLGITTVLFIVFSFLLGQLMAYHSVWFCNGCLLR